jgi:hypothetical protein
MLGGSGHGGAGGGCGVGGSASASDTAPQAPLAHAASGAAGADDAAGADGARASGVDDASEAGAVQRDSPRQPCKCWPPEMRVIHRNVCWQNLRGECRFGPELCRYCHNPACAEAKPAPPTRRSEKDRIRKALGRLGDNFDPKGRGSV